MTNREAMKAKHVVHPDLRYAASKEVWPLVDARSHEQTPIGRSTQCYATSRTSISIIDEPLCATMKVVKAVLFSVHRSCLVPLFAVLSTASIVSKILVYIPPDQTKGYRVPRRLGMAIVTLRCRMRTRRKAEKDGVREILKPP